MSKKKPEKRLERVLLERKFMELWERKYDLPIGPTFLGFAVKKERPLSSPWHLILESKGVPKLDMNNAASLERLRELDEDQANGLHWVWDNSDVTFHSGADLRAAMQEVLQEIKPSDTVIAFEDGDLAIIEVKELSTKDLTHMTSLLLEDIAWYEEEERRDAEKHKLRMLERKLIDLVDDLGVDAVEAALAKLPKGKKDA